MTTAYNLQRKLMQMREVNAHLINDPGSGGTVQISPHLGMAVLVIESDGTRTLESAANVPVGTKVLVFSSTASATVNSTAIADGGYAEFICGVDASGDNEWKVVDPADITTNATDIATNAADIANLQTLPVNAQTGTTYTLLSTDAGKIVTLSNASGITLTVPDTLVAGFQCKIIQIGAGLVTVTGGGSMTVNTESGAATLDAQHGAGEITVYATNACNFHRYDVSGT